MTHAEVEKALQEVRQPPVAVKVRGKVTGYVCPRCGQMPGVSRGRPGSKSDVAAKREWATRCCVCSCGYPVEGERRGLYSLCGRCQTKADEAIAADAPKRAAELDARCGAERAVVNGPCDDAERRLRALHGKWSFWDSDVSFEALDFAACRVGADAIRENTALRAEVAMLRRLVETRSEGRKK